VTDKLFEVLSPEWKEQVEKTRNKLLEKLKSLKDYEKINLASLRDLPKEEQEELLEKVNWRRKTSELKIWTEKFEKFVTIEELIKNIQKKFKLKNNWKNRLTI
jgi:hypothetical protein